MVESEIDPVPDTKHDNSFFKELNRRSKAFETGEDKGTTWKEVKKKTLFLRK